MPIQTNRLFPRMPVRADITILGFGLSRDIQGSWLPPFTRQHVFSDGHIRFGFDRYPANGMFNFALALVRLGYLSLANLDRQS